MKHVNLLIVWLLFFNNSFAQTISENFSTNPLQGWSGDTLYFSINDEELQSKGSTAGGEIFLSHTLPEMDNLSWEFTVKTLFNPSSANHARYFLSSDCADLLSDTLSGYYLKLGGESGRSDALSLYRTIHGKTKKLSTGTPGILGKDSNEIKIKVSRDPLGEWKIYTDTGSHYFLDQKLIDTTYNPGGYTGLAFKYTSTRRDLFFFDELNILPGKLSILETKQESPYEIRISFSNSLSSVENLFRTLPEVSDINSISGSEYILHLTKRRKTLDLHIPDLMDIYGYKLDTSFTLFLDPYFPVSPEKGDLLLSEILYDPVKGGSDFVEIYNASAEYLDLSQVQVCNKDDKCIYYPEEEGPLPPESYLAISKDIHQLFQYYKPPPGANIQKTATLPSFTNDSGIVVIRKLSEVALDSFSYYSFQHFRLLEETEGISLERISFNIPAEELTNWHSSASVNSYATPGYRNSQGAEDDPENPVLSIEPTILFPDGDGYKDFARILLNLPGNGYTGTISIYSSEGFEIKKLINNKLFGTHSQIIWDGLNDSGHKVVPGYYIVFLRLINPEGETSSHKKTVIVGLD